MKINGITRKIFGVLAAIFILSVTYYGTFLPMRKSQIFIEALRGLSSIKSLSDLEKSISVPLDAPSPIGQEELVRNASNVIFNLVQQNNKPEVMAELINYLNSYYGPILARGRGMSFEQNLYLMGAINEVAFMKTKQVQYLAASEKYYGRGLELGPKRPQVLYGIFDVYRAEGNIEKAKAIGEQILSQWPQDDRVRQGLKDFLSQTSPAATIKK